MKPKQFAVSSVIVLLTSATSIAGNGYFTQVGRNIGYGIGDGYHAHRYCFDAETSCSSCSAVPQQTQQQQPMMPQPALSPAYSPWVPQQIQQAGYPIGYPAAPTYQPRYQQFAPAYGPPMMPSVAGPSRNSASRW